jgi:5-hydroxyisourate hydrolase-like protein (transthyretin family)
MRKYKAPPPAARIEVTVLKADTGKPIQDAHVIFHPIEGERDKGSMEIKTDEDGKISLDIIPLGDTVRLQVIANGFQTYGDDYKVDKAKLTWEVCLRRPGPQYSIYTNHPTSLGATTCPDNISRQKSGSSSAVENDKSPNASQGTAPAIPDNKSSDSGNQPDRPPTESRSEPQPN